MPQPCGSAPPSRTSRRRSRRRRAARQRADERRVVEERGPAEARRDGAAERAHDGRRRRECAAAQLGAAVAARHPRAWAGGAAICARGGARRRRGRTAAAESGVPALRREQRAAHGLEQRALALHEERRDAGQRSPSARFHIKSRARVGEARQLAARDGADDARRGRGSPRQFLGSTAPFEPPTSPSAPQLPELERSRRAVVMAEVADGGSEHDEGRKAE